MDKSKKIKALISFFCVAILCIGLVGCSKDKDVNSNGQPDGIADKKENDASKDVKDKETDDLKDTSKYEDSFSFKLDSGDDKHIFDIFMGTTPIDNNENHKYDKALKIVVYKEDNPDVPYQVIDTFTRATLFKDCIIVDVNFDGYSDFYYYSTTDSTDLYYTFWVWDTKTEMFLEDDKLADIPFPLFDTKNKVISSSSSNFNNQTFYKYIDAELTCVRIMDRAQEDEKTQILTVQDYIDGKLVEVFNKKTKSDDSENQMINDEFRKWENLNYHGTN